MITHTATERFVVIIVEDEPLIRMSLVDMVAELGFEVLDAKDAQDALAILNVQAARIGILITDINMPGTIDGIVLANQTKRNWPWISVCVTSGNMPPTIGQLPAGTRFFPKPYDCRTVVAHVAQIAGTAYLA